MSYSNIIHQKSYEKIIHHLRRDIINFIPYILLLILLLGLGFGMYLFLTNIFPQIIASVLGKAIILLFGSIYLLSVWLFFYTSFIDYYLDIWLVTNDRIIDIRQEGLFGRTVAELDLYRVQDVTSECKGIFPTMFNFGNVYIQTAGEKQRFTFFNIPDPHHIREEIIRLTDEDRKFHLGQEKETT